MGTDVSWENGSEDLRKLWVFWLSFLGVGLRAVFWVFLWTLTVTSFFSPIYTRSVLGPFYTVTD